MEYDVNHILFTTGTDGEEWRYATDLARLLSGFEVRSTLVTMGEPTFEQREEAETVQDLTLINSVFRTESMEDPWADVDAAGLWLLALVQQIKPDLVHLRSAVQASLPFETPVVASYHGANRPPFSVRRSKQDQAEYERRLELGLESADLVVASTQTAVEELQNRVGPLARSVVVPLGIEESARREESKKNMVLAVGEAGDAGKGFFRQIAPSLSWPLYLVDENGRSAERVRNLVRLGAIRQPTLSAWLAKTTVFAQHSNHQLLDYHALEAAMSSAVLVLGDEPALRERWEGVARFPAPDPESWVKVLNDLAEDPDQAAEMGRMARERAMEFTARDMAQAMLGIYRNLRLACLLDANPSRRARLL